ncbi:hypothetical protein GJAV_G00069740 [Gymnothorax javanicus]|nr:hypothetical protein GJAV_G00069740 [Gymnothorax javanicus]
MDRSTDREEYGNSRIWLDWWRVLYQPNGHDLGLNNLAMESSQRSADGTRRASVNVKLGGEDHAGRRERPSSLLWLQQADSPQADGTTPQGEEPQLPPSLQNTSSVNEDSQVTSSQLQSQDPPLDRHASERNSRFSIISQDVNANEHQISEQSDTESPVEENRVLQQAHGRLYVNRVFHMSADKMFELLFSESLFIRRFMEARKITGATSTPWKRDAGGSMKRTLKYTITITNPLVGKFSTATEIQTLYKDSHVGQYFMVDAEVYTHDVPYHDYFYTFNRFLIIRNSKSKCRLRVYTDVKYKKQPWGLVKSFITKNSWSGLEDYFRHLESELLEEEAELTRGTGDSKMGALRRRRRTYSRSHSDHLKTSKQYNTETEHQGESLSRAMELKRSHRGNMSSMTILVGMSVILVFLMFLNLGLFFKLWAMEDVAHQMYLSARQHQREKKDFSLTPGLDTRSIKENQLLQTVLQDSINLLEQLRTSLKVLQRNFEVYNRTGL